MNNFKIGDKVRRVSPVSCELKRTTGIQKDGIYTIGESYGKAITLEESYQRTFTFATANFELVAAMGDDDELPPAPESVRYATLQYSWQGQYNDQALTVGPDTFTGSIALRIQGNSNSTRNKDMSLSVILDADDVLRLAHDLRRMAMEIKRKGRQG